MKYSSRSILFFTFLCAILISERSIAQNLGNTAKEDVYVDKRGIMRWGQNDTEVKGFGVNYTAPFAHAYRTADKFGIDLKKAIDNDVYHLTRLGFDLYRVHVWDTEISDAKGNLLENEHLELFDYLIKQLKDRGFNFVITPIAYWGNGWPEPDEDTPGFSNKYGKENSLTNPQAIKAQQNYLAQFLNHVNPYTGIAYKNEPNIIAFEISNEPHHRGTPEEVTRFIEGMVSSMRSTGTKKPIFYNVSHSVHLAEAYFNADIQGGTFQWYPTGLGFGEELQGNLLPNVDDYEIPFDSVIKKNSGAKLVYEFDAADVMKSYIYPAMARSFREAGIQIATHFAYDPTFMAAANTEYNTHYMNLAYTPQKALALMISGEVFHRVPMYKDFGVYPENKTFGPFHVNYEKDLAVLNAPEEFIYTNNITTEPVAVSSLKKIAGYGNSTVVKYEGKGAYFLDKLEDGLWRLEVMPDAILVRNPFGTNSLEKEVAVINWKEWEMKLNLPDLDKNFEIIPINEGNAYQPEINRNSFSIWPGTYFIKKNGISTSFSPEDKWKNIRLNEFFAPKTTVEKTYLMHQPIPEIIENSTLVISAEIVSGEPIEKVEAWLQNNNMYESVELERKNGYIYSAKVPKSILKKGFLNYRIIVFTEDGAYTYPGGVEGKPNDWDFYNQNTYETRIVSEENRLVLFNATTDSDEIVGQWMEGLALVPTKVPGQAEYQINVEQLFKEDPENLNAEPIYDYSFRYYFRDKIAGRTGALKTMDSLIIKGRGLNDKPVKLQVAFVMKNGASFGKVITLQPEIKDHKISLDDLQLVKTVTLPRPYPTFLPYYFEHDLNQGFDIENVESLQFSIGPGLTEEQLKEAHGVGIIHVWLK